MLCDTRTDGMPTPTEDDGVGEMGRQGAPLQASLPEGGGTGLPVTEGVLRKIGTKLRNGHSFSRLWRQLPPGGSLGTGRHNKASLPEGGGTGLPVTEGVGCCLTANDVRLRRMMFALQQMMLPCGNSTKPPSLWHSRVTR